ncbi:MAG: membrane-associated protease RseP (regulator of RpoE activity) [Kiritimatiellia bacterium]|jgi:membrane-associated protease RseP (regulator of RpoE activity)
MKIRILIEVIIVLALAFFAYTRFITPQKPDPAEALAQARADEESTSRLNELIKKSKTTKPREAAPTVAAAQDFKPEATSVQRDPEPVPVVAETTLAGRIVDENGALILDPVTVYSTNCRFTGISSQGSFNILVQPGVCVVSAQRTVGEYLLEAQAVELVITEGVANPLTLVMPSQLVGTVGIDLILHDAYAEVATVAPDSPAAQIGMEPGHVIVEINGHKVAGLSQDQIAATLIGPVGEEVRMLIVVEDADGNLQEIPVALGRVVLP